MNGRNTFKAQSAMEYLMTYGWAILIISIVLGSLFSLGVFSTSSFASTACIPSSGYSCSITQYSHGATGIVATIGQSTGTSWNAFAYYFCSGCTLGTGGYPTAAYNAAPTSTTMATGSSQSVYLLVPASATSTVGTVVSGSVWVCWTAIGYTMTTSCTASGTGPVNWAQIATLTAKST